MFIITDKYSEKVNSVSYRLPNALFPIYISNMKNIIEDTYSNKKSNHDARKLQSFQSNEPQHSETTIPLPKTVMTSYLPYGCKQYKNNAIKKEVI